MEFNINGIVKVNRIVFEFLSRKKIYYCVCFSFSTEGGKCGICGEPYDRANKLFEKGGAYYTGKVVKTYRQGQQIDVQVVVSEDIEE